MNRYEDITNKIPKNVKKSSSSSSSSGIWRTVDDGSENVFKRVNSRRFIQNLPLLFRVVQVVKRRWIFLEFLEFDSQELYLSLKNELENRSLEFTSQSKIREDALEFILLFGM